MVQKSSIGRNLSGESVYSGGGKPKRRDAKEPRSQGRPRGHREDVWARKTQKGPG